MGVLSWVLTLLNDFTADAYFPLSSAFIPASYAGYQDDVFAQMEAATLNVDGLKNGGRGSEEETLTSCEFMVVVLGRSVWMLFE